MDAPRTLDLNLAPMHTTALLVLLAFFVVFGVLSVGDKNLTTDESRHYRYGVNLLEGNTDRFDDSKMPFSAWNALPAKLASWLPDGALKDLLGQLVVARLMTILFSAALALLVFHWARSLYGLVPAFFSLLLYIFDPNIIAHSQLVTTDLYATGTILLVFYCLWRFARQRTLTNGLLCALTLGLSQVAKYTSVVLLPLCLFALFLYDLPQLVDAYKQNAAGTIKMWLRNYAVYTLVAVLVSILVINVCFLFNRTFTRFGAYKFRSDLFQMLQSDVPLLRKLPVPTPYPFLEGLDWVIQRSNAHFPVYFLGKVQREGFPGYYLVAFLLKEPIATQLLILGAVIVWLRDPKRRRRVLQDELFLLVPVAFFVVYFNLFYHVQIGIRYYLVIFPFLYIFAGSLFTGWQQFSVFQKRASALLVAYLAISVFSYYPYYLPYFNELVWDRTQGYKYLADSNIDWGQSSSEISSYLAQHPDAMRAPTQPQAGHFIVSVNGLVGLISKRDDRKWLRTNFEPDGTLAYSYLIYKISPQEIEKLCATTEYCQRADD